jgi:hypothetical protein
MSVLLTIAVLGFTGFALLWLFMRYRKMKPSKNKRDRMKKRSIPTIYEKKPGDRIRKKILSRGKDD